MVVPFTPFRKTPMAKVNNKKAAARVIKALLDSGVKIKSPYDITNFIHDNLSSELFCQFFYSRSGKDLNLSAEIKKALPIKRR